MEGHQPTCLFTPFITKYLLNKNNSKNDTYMKVDEDLQSYKRCVQRDQHLGYSSIKLYHSVLRLIKQTCKKGKKVI